MTEKIIQSEYDVTKKSRILRFYDFHKKKIYIIFSILIITIISFVIYLNIKEKNKILISDNYIEAKIYLEKGEKAKARDLLKQTIKSNDSTYSLLSLYLLQQQKLIVDEKELSDLYNYLLKEVNFKKDQKELLIFKKALIDSNFASESELLKLISPLVSGNSIWKAQALLFLGDYFYEKKENFKAKEFYLKILDIKNLNKEMYSEAQRQLSLISND